MSYGFGIVGLGLIADFHAQAIEAMDNGKVVACLSRSKEKADAFAHKLGCTGYSSMEDFLAHPGLDIVTVCCSNASCIALRSSGVILSSSSIHTIPLFAKTRVPASRAQPLINSSFR